jgi:ABC-type sugar transport system substrate-binding protein
LWKESKGEDRYRRAIYTYFKRTSPYPSLITFDAGSREVCLINRISTNTPLQALVTLNDPVYMEAALALAQQEENNPSPAVAIDNMYQKALYIKPDAATQTVLLDLYQQALQSYETRPEQLEQFLDRETPTQKKLAALTLVANAIMNLDAFLTHS